MTFGLAGILKSATSQPGSLAEARADFRKGSEIVGKTVERLTYLREVVVDERLAQAKEKAEACASELNAFLTSDSRTLDGDSKRLKDCNVKAFDAERGLHEFQDEISSDVKDMAEKLNKLAADCLRFEIQRARFNFNNCFIGSILEDSLHLSEMAKFVSNLKTEMQGTTSQNFSKVQESVFREWKCAFQDFRKQQNYFLKNNLVSKKNHITTSIDELDGYICAQYAFDPKKFTILAGTVPAEVTAEWDGIVKEYQNKCKKQKEITVQFWNTSLLDMMVVDLKLQLITDCKENEANIITLAAKFKQLRDDLETLRHQFKGKNIAETDRVLVGNHVHLNSRFEELKSTYQDLKTQWDDILSPWLCPILSGYEAKLKAFSEQESLAFGTQDHPLDGFKGKLKRLLDEEMKQWINPVQSLFKNAQEAIKTDLTEIQLWMEISTAVVENPTWTDFPKRSVYWYNRLTYSKYWYTYLPRPPQPPGA